MHTYTYIVYIHTQYTYIHSIHTYTIVVVYTHSSSSGSIHIHTQQYMYVYTIHTHIQQQIHTTTTGQVGTNTCTQARGRSCQRLIYIETDPWKKTIHAAGLFAEHLFSRNRHRTFVHLRRTFVLRGACFSTLKCESETPGGVVEIFVSRTSLGRLLQHAKALKRHARSRGRTGAFVKNLTHSRQKGALGSITPKGLTINNHQSLMERRTFVRLV